MAINTSIRFVVGTKRIFLPSPLVLITNQDILDSSNNFLDEIQVNRVPNFISAGGRDPIPGGNVGVTVNIFDGWTVEWEAEAGPGLVQKTILGNFNAFTDSTLITPADIFTPTANVFPLISQSFAPTEFVTGSGLDATQDAKLTRIDDNISYQNKIINNYRELRKIGLVWYLIVYDDGQVTGGTEILRKAMQDKDGNNISDLVAGVLAAELENVV